MGGKQRGQSSQRKDTSNVPEARGEYFQMLQDIKAKLDDESTVSKERYESLCAKFEEVTQENAMLKEELVKLNKKVLDQEDEMHVLREQVNDLMQDRINKNFVIKGVPEVGPTLALDALVPLILKEIGISLRAFEIMSIKRIGQLEQGKCRPILVTVIDNKTKLNVIRAKRSRNLNANMFCCAGNPLGTEKDKIYIDEHLTKTNMHLFMEARKLRSMGMKFVWTSNGAVLTRKKEGDKVLRIRNFEQLSTLFVNLSKPKTPNLGQQHTREKRKEISPLQHNFGNGGEAPDHGAHNGKRPKADDDQIILSDEENHVENFKKKLEAAMQMDTGDHDDNV